MTAAQLQLVAGEPLQRMLRHEAVAAGVAGPEIADDALFNKCGGFCCDHRIGADRASRQIASTRCRTRGFGRQDFSNCWHRDLLSIQWSNYPSCTNYTPGTLTMSQHKCVRSEKSILQCSADVIHLVLLRAMHRERFVTTSSCDRSNACADASLLRQFVSASDSNLSVKRTPCLSRHAARAH